MTAIGIATALLLAQPAPGPELLAFDDAAREAQARNLGIQAASRSCCCGGTTTATAARSPSRKPRATATDTATTTAARAG